MSNGEIHLDDQLGSSILGTKQHWDNVYKSELKSFEDCGDEGEVWFGEKASQRMIKGLSSFLPAESDLKKGPVIDLGCGNGMLMVDLWDAGYKNLVGVDYSAEAVALATSVTSSKGVTAKIEVKNITQWDGPLTYFTIALDKGTYDAISLDPDDSVSKRESYITNVSKMLVAGGVLVITTCNWTESEIISQFSLEFVYQSTLPSPKFTFGGQTGNNVTTVIFKKR